MQFPMSILSDYILFAFGIIGGLISLWQGMLWYLEWQESRIDTLASVDSNGLRLIEQIRRVGFQPDVVIGIGRSGAFLGGWIAGNLGSLPIDIVDRHHTDDPSNPANYTGIEQRIGLLRTLYGDTAKALIVEGATTSGVSLQQCSKHLKTFAPGWTCKYAVLYEVETSKFPTDFVARRIKRAPRRYPWHKTVDYKRYLRRGEKVSLL